MANFYVYVETGGRENEGCVSIYIFDWKQVEWNKKKWTDGLYYSTIVLLADWAVMHWGILLIINITI